MLTNVDCCHYWRQQQSISLFHHVVLNDVRDVWPNVEHLGESEKNPQEIPVAIRNLFKVSAYLN